MTAEYRSVQTRMWREDAADCLQNGAWCGMMGVTKKPTKQRQSAVFVCRKTTAYLRTGTKPGTVEVCLSRCDSALDDGLVGTQPYRALCIGKTEIPRMAGRKHTRNAASQQCARKRIISQRGERCEKCGSRAIVELHHIIEAKDGGTFADDNCILLCWLCHQKAHGNKPGRKGLDSYNAERSRLGEI